MDTFIGLGLFALIGVLVIGGIALGIYFHQQHQERIAQAYQHICRMYGGQFTPAGWFQSASAQFPTKGGMAMLDIYTTGGKHKRSYTRLWLPWPDPNLYLNIAPQGFFGMLGEMIGTGDHKVGDPAFDERYYVSTNVPQYLPRIVNPGSRQRINNLYDLLGNYSIDWTIESGGMRIMKDGIIDDAQQLQYYVQETLGLYEAALGQPAGQGNYGNPASYGGQPNYAQGSYGQPAKGGYPQQDLGPIPFDPVQKMPPVRHQ